MLIRSGVHVQHIPALSFHDLLRNEVPSPARNYQGGLKVTLFISDAQSSYMIEVRADDKPSSFSELQKALKMESGNLNYHLIRMQSRGIITKSDDERKYALDAEGHEVAQVLKRFLKAEKQYK